MKTKLKELPKEIVLRLLIDNIDDNNDFILLLSRWNSNENDKKLGLLTLENYKMYRARIEHALNEYIDDLSKDDVNKVFNAAGLDGKTASSHSSNTTTVIGDGNTVIQGNSGDITIIKDSKNVVTGSELKAGGDIHIGDSLIASVTGKKSATPLQEEQLVLFLAANPTQHAQLNLYKEHCMIASELSENLLFQFKWRFAVSKVEMNELIDELNPTILHFAGHGSSLDTARIALIKEGIDLVDDTGLIFHNDQKNGIEVLNADESRLIFRGLKKLCSNLQIIILNACHSHSQAAAISECGFFTIGTENKIKDQTANAFAKGFYKKYAKTYDITKAIQFGIIQANTTLMGELDAKNLIHLYQNGEKIQL